MRQISAYIQSDAEDHHSYRLLQRSGGKQQRDNLESYQGEQEVKALTGKEIISLALNATTAVAKRAESALAYLDPDRLIKCRAGCSLCCSLEVGVRPFEVIGIAAFIHSNLPAEKFRQVRSRINSMAKHYLGFDERRGKHSVVSCPLLENDYCIAYPVRPSACIVHTSYDPRACDPISARGPVKSNPLFQSTIWNFADGYELLFSRAANKSPDWLEFVIALDAIVDDPDSDIGKWIAGKDIFLSARIHR